MGYPKVQHHPNQCPVWGRGGPWISGILIFLKLEACSKHFLKQQFKTILNQPIVPSFLSFFRNVHTGTLAICGKKPHKNLTQDSVSLNQQLQKDPKNSTLLHFTPLHSTSLHFVVMSCAVYACYVCNCKRTRQSLPTIMNYEEVIVIEQCSSLSPSVIDTLAHPNIL